MGFFKTGDGNDIRPSKLRGQNFLTDKNIVKKIIAAAELTGDDIVLEVGPGLGVLTREILPNVKQLNVVELDPLFVHELREEFGDKDNIKIIESDILKLKISDLVTNYKLITNLPYNITSAFLKKILTEPSTPERIVIMLQKEVADRIAGTNSKPQQPNAKPDGMLGLMCNLYAECSPVCRVAAGCFSPPPKVDSAVICLKPYSNQAFLDKWGIEREFAEDIISFASVFFKEQRKKMCGRLNKERAMACKEALIAIGESSDSRPAELSLYKWVELWKKMR